MIVLFRLKPMPLPHRLFFRAVLGPELPTLVVLRGRLAVATMHADEVVAETLEVLEALLVAEIPSLFLGEAAPFVVDDGLEAPAAVLAELAGVGEEGRKSCFEGLVDRGVVCRGGRLVEHVCGARA